MFQFGDVTTGSCFEFWVCTTLVYFHYVLRFFKYPQPWNTFHWIWWLGVQVFVVDGFMYLENKSRIPCSNIRKYIHAQNFNALQLNLYADPQNCVHSLQFTQFSILNSRDRIAFPLCFADVPKNSGESTNILRMSLKIFTVIYPWVHLRLFEDMI